MTQYEQARRDICIWLSGRRNQTYKQLQAALLFKDATLGRALRDLTSEGLIRRHKGEKQRHVYNRI